MRTFIQSLDGNDSLPRRPACRAAPALRGAGLDRALDEGGGKCGEVRVREAVRGDRPDIPKVAAGGVHLVQHGEAAIVSRLMLGLVLRIVNGVRKVVLRALYGGWRVLLPHRVRVIVVPVPRPQVHAA